MPNQYLIDSCVWIEYLDGNLKIRKYINSILDQIVFSPIIYAEVTAGLENITKKHKLFLTIYENSPTQPIDAEVGEVTEKIHKQVRKMGLGHNKVVPDYYLASTCLVNNLTLVTVNKKDFWNIKDLKAQYFDLRNDDWHN